MEGTRAALEAAHRVYYAFWGKGSLDRLLQPVPGRNLKYFPKTLIDFLQIQSLSYNGSILLIRDEYELAFTKLQEEEGKEKEIRSSGMVVTGQPGIGKHLAPVAIFSAKNCLIQIQGSPVSHTMSCFASWP